MYLLRAGYIFYCFRKLFLPNKLRDWKKYININANTHSSLVAINQQSRKQNIFKEYVTGSEWSI